uniref:Plasmid stabilization system, antitoxin protein RelB n=1 Tax=Thermococcus sp. CIR10 TaxID=1197731 RepID=L0BAF7_9EURY|nr:hypothetical protein [Thermococcus sp. CIR10]AFZ84261.1 plasmid stabilization system, antitoxin protein RelB [Thermococcus sp. CIR10]
MEANAVNVLLEDVREMKKKLEEMEIELLKLKAEMLEEEEADPEYIEKAYKEAKELIRKGELLTLEEALKELEK